MTGAIVCVHCGDPSPDGANLCAECFDALVSSDGNAPDCSVEGCKKVGLGVGPDAAIGKPEAYFCRKHAHERGWCVNCGEYHGGDEEFEFSPSKLCGECADADRAFGPKRDGEDDYEPSTDGTWSEVTR